MNTIFKYIFLIGITALLALMIFDAINTHDAFLFKP